MYEELQQAFGWEADTRVFATYRALTEVERPRSAGEDRNQWLVHSSRKVGHNLGPFLKTRGVPISLVAQDSIADMPTRLQLEFQPR